MTNLRVVVSLLAEDQEFQRLQAAEAREAAFLRGLEVEVLFAENNPIVQIQQLFKAVHADPASRPCAIVTETVTGEGLERVARNAVKAGIGWILINRRVGYLEDLARRHSGVPVSSVGTDQAEVGRIQGRQFLALLPHGGNLVYIQGPPDTSVAQERRAGMESVVAGRPIRVHVASGLWTEKSGEQAIQSFLRLKTWEQAPPDLVAGQNDAMAMGALRALRAFPGTDLSYVLVTGCDGLRDGGRRLVDTGELAATVVTRSNTGPALELLAQYLKTRRPLPADVLLPATSYPVEAKLAPSTVSAANRTARLDPRSLSNPGAG